MRNHNDCIQNLQSAGISYEDACALRRISMTLRGCALYIVPRARLDTYEAANLDTCYSSRGIAVFK